jgi:hypothetical protein
LKFSPLVLTPYSSYFYDSCSRTRIGSENYYPEQKAAVEAYVERTAKPERERMADVKTIFGVYRSLLSILYQRASSGLIGIMSCRIRNRSCYGGSLVEKEIMLLLTL